MLTRLGFAINYSLGRDIAGRSFGRYPDDIFLIAFPGSGGQWLRWLVANLANPGCAATQADIDHRVPSLYAVPRRALMNMARPRIIFSHEAFDPDCRNKVVYLVRDPRDVAVSIYKQRQDGHREGELAGLQQFVSTWFMRTDQYQGGWAEDSCGKIRQDHGFFYRTRLKEEFLGTPASWGENVASWLGACGNVPGAMLVVRSEDLVFDAEGVLRSVSEYLNLGRSAEEIREAVRVSCANSNIGMPEQPGKWKTTLPPSSVQEIESVWGSLMSMFGYPMSAEMDSVCANPHQLI